MHVRFDEQALVTGSADKDIKFWDFEWRDADGTKVNISYTRQPMHSHLVVQSHTGRNISLVHTRTLKMTDDVLSVRYSPDGKLLAVALLDSTVKVFHQDSLKFFLSLYGHKASFTARPPSTRPLTSFLRLFSYQCCPWTSLVIPNSS